MKKEKQKKKKHTIRNFFILLLLIISGVILYSRFIGTKGLIIKEYAVVSDKLPSSFDGFKIVHFSDLHYGSTIFINQLKDIVNQINELKPDVIVFTGDLIDKGYNLSDDEKTSIIDLLNDLDPSIAMYAVRGNHDVNNTYTDIISQTNFIELDNSNALIYYQGITPIRIVGLDDYLNSNQDYDTAFNYDQTTDTYYTILLAHEPDTLDKITNYNVNLMLSGHSHGGQIRIPFVGAIIKPVGAKKYYDDKYIVGNTTLFVSSGLGTSSYPFRLFNRPSINFYRLYTS